MLEITVVGSLINEGLKAHFINSCDDLLKGIDFKNF